MRGYGYTELMEILDQVIKKEFLFKYELCYKLKDVRVIYNFQGDLKELVDSILLSFGDEYLKELQYFHKREYIIRYVTRTVQLLLMEYTQKNKVKTK
jgi:hypothetical protein